MVSYVKINVNVMIQKFVIESVDVYKNCILVI